MWPYDKGDTRIRIGPTQLAQEGSGQNYITDAIQPNDEYATCVLYV
jgi:hypothetical protein